MWSKMHPPGGFLLARILQPTSRIGQWLFVAATGPASAVMPSMTRVQALVELVQASSQTVDRNVLRSRAKNPLASIDSYGSRCSSDWPESGAGPAAERPERDTTPAARNSRPRRSLLAASRDSRPA